MKYKRKRLTGIIKSSNEFSDKTYLLDDKEFSFYLNGIHGNIYLKINEEVYFGVLDYYSEEYPTDDGFLDMVQQKFTIGNTNMFKVLERYNKKYVEILIYWNEI